MGVPHPVRASYSYLKAGWTDCVQTVFTENQQANNVQTSQGHYSMLVWRSACKRSQWLKLSHACQCNCMLEQSRTSWFVKWKTPGHQNAQEIRTKSVDGSLPSIDVRWEKLGSYFWQRVRMISPGSPLSCEVKTKGVKHKKTRRAPDLYKLSIRFNGSLSNCEKA